MDYELEWPHQLLDVANEVIFSPFGPALVTMRARGAVTLALMALHWVADLSP